MAVSQRRFRTLQQWCGPLIQKLFGSRLLELGIVERFVVTLYNVYKSFEATSEELIGRYLEPGIVVLDIGAHFGYYTTRFSSLVGEVGEVIAWEPNDSSRRILERQLARRSIRNVRVVPFAAWSTSTNVQLNVDGPLGVTSHIRTSSEVGGIRVEGRAIDDLVLGLGNARVGFIKIDVEGAEVEALSGAKHTLIKHRPVVLCEIGSDYGISAAAHLSKLFNLLDATDYECCDVSGTEIFTEESLGVSLKTLRYLDVILRPCSLATVHP
jgi:FkbM family methyltransferase